MFAMTLLFFGQQIIQDSDQVETVIVEKQQRDEVFDEQQFSEENLLKEVGGYFSDRSISCMVSVYLLGCVIEGDI